MKEKEFRVIGNAPETEKKKVKAIILSSLEKRPFEETQPLEWNHTYGKTLTAQEREIISKTEIEKSPMEEELIRWANDVTNQMLEKIGMAPYDVPTGNFHMVPAETYEGLFGDESRGISSEDEQAVLLNTPRVREGFLIFGLTVLHEMLHLKAYMSVEVNNQKGTTKIAMRRAGFKVLATPKKVERGQEQNYFSGLDEAIVSTIEVKSITELFDHPLIREERSWLQPNALQAFQQNASKALGVPTNELEIAFNLPDKTLLARVPGYHEQRQVLAFVCEQIQQEFPDQFSTTDEVLQEFFKAHFTGRLLSIGRLMKKTFGKNGFRILGVMNPDPDSAINCLEALQKARLEAKKQKNA